MLSSMAQARPFNIRFSFFIFNKYLQSAFVPGWTFNEFPTFANIRMLAVIVPKKNIQKR